MSIPPYNGGLFALDAIVDALVLPDGLAKDIAALGHWDYRREAPVTVLGHIFEQSITDIERLKAESRARPPPEVSKRKREGVVYTPDMVTRFLVESTVGVTLEGTRCALGGAWHEAAGFASEPETESAGCLLARLSRGLAELTIIDPACGSGAFLVAAFMNPRCHGEYVRSIKRAGRAEGGCGVRSRRRNPHPQPPWRRPEPGIGGDHAAFALVEDGAARTQAREPRRDDPRRRQPDR